MEVKEIVSACPPEERRVLVNSKNSDGFTPLMQAALAGGNKSAVLEAVACAHYLLENGAGDEILAKGKIRYTAADYGICIYN